MDMCIIDLGAQIDLIWAYIRSGPHLFQNIQYWADLVKCRPKSNHVSQKFLEKHLRAPHIAVPTLSTAPPPPPPSSRPLPSLLADETLLPSPPHRRRPPPQSRCTPTGAPGGSDPSGTASGRAAARAPGLTTRKGAVLELARFKSLLVPPFPCSLALHACGF